VAAASNTYFNIQNSYPAYIMLVFPLILTSIDRHASEHQLTIFFVKGKHFMRNTTNHCACWSIFPNESSGHDHESLKMWKYSVSYEVRTEF